MCYFLISERERRKLEVVRFGGGRGGRERSCRVHASLLTSVDALPRRVSSTSVLGRLRDPLERLSDLGRVRSCRGGGVLERRLTIHPADEDVAEARADEGRSRDGDLFGVGVRLDDEEVVLLITVLRRKMKH